MCHLGDIPDTEDEIRANRIMNRCEKCPLRDVKHTNYVPAEATIDAEILLIGEAPGENEVKHGKPFIGRSGTLLRQIMDKTKLSYNISNIVKCRPTTSTNDNRCPTASEINACFPMIEHEIESKQYKLVVLFGRVALNAFFPDKKITQTAGQILVKDNIRFLIMYHPSYILRNQNTKIETEWKSRLLKIKEDIL